MNQDLGWLGADTIHDQFLNRSGDSDIELNSTCQMAEGLLHNFDNTNIY